MELCESIDQELCELKLRKKKEVLAGGAEGMLVGDYVLLAEDVCGYAENRVICHEIEHRRTCGKNLMNAPRDLRNKLEAVAERRTVLRLAPVETLVSLYLSGARTSGELAAALEVDERLISTALALYDSIYGHSALISGHRVTFMPFCVK